jgi:hypothetical protein
MRAQRPNEGHGVTVSRNAHALMIGISGPDGAGKTSLAEGISSVVADRGGTVVRIHLYGCVLCRYLPRTNMSRSLSSRGQMSDSRLSRVMRASTRVVLLIHAFIEVLEYTLRLGKAQIGVAMCRDTLRARSVAVAPEFSTALLVTDRSPLDALVKHDPPSDSRTASAFIRLLSWYDHLFWLDAPPDVLARRDREHDAVALTAARGRFEAWSHRLPTVVRMDSQQHPSALLATLLYHLELEAV